MSFITIEFLKDEHKLSLIDQRKLPAEKEYFLASNYQDVIYAISEMV